MSMIAYKAVVDEAWARLRAAGEDPRHPMHVVVLATVSGDSRPDARWMVVRGADRDMNRLWCYSDVRSAKIEQLRGNPAVCVVAGDRDAGISVRLRGTATVHTEGALAETHWNHASMAVQALFGGCDPPGRTLSVTDPRLRGMKRSFDAGQAEAARDNFAVIEVTIDSIEWLEIVDDRQRRAIARAGDGWLVQAMAP